MKIFASDYDGTFIRSNAPQGELEENIWQVARWREAGNLFVFATGRDMPDLIDYLSEGLICDYLVCINGGLVATGAGEIIFAEIIPQHTADEIMSMIRENGIKNPWISNITKNGPGKIAFAMDTPEAAYEMADVFKRRFEDRVTIFSNEQCVDITALGVTKATGIAMIAERHNIPDDDIYCIGDSHNDVPMLRAYTGFTLPGVDDVVRAAAAEVYGSVGEVVFTLLTIQV
ncbi:MAG: HAD-IIB family hydrolase [Defluviitaleaceae bacterium]|nr:HAD-IIB family hydrolase [Defluviitaleaceae bacterium]